MVSNWRQDLREIVDEIEKKAEKKVKETKGINNKVVINPKLDEAVKELGGELLEVTEIDKKEEPKEDSALKQKEKQANNMKKRVLLQKLRAVRSGGGADIMASHEPEIDSAIEYFYEEGINEEGIDLIIEEIGLEEFVVFVDFIQDETKFLNEERAARKASVRAKKFDVVKKEVDKADAARRKAKKGEYAPSYAKKETDVTVYDDKPTAKKKAPVKKTVVKKAAPKPVAKKPVTKNANPKVVKAVAKVKKTQPTKKVTKQGLGDKIRSAYKAGVKRHRKATQGARVFGKGFAAGAKKAVKFAKDVKKVVSEEELLEKDLSAAERRALPNKDFVFPGKGEGPEGKQRGAYPINDKKHARAALAMAAAHASPEKEAKVKAAVKKKYPDIEVSEATLMDKIKKWRGKKKKEKKASMDKTTEKLHDWRHKNSPEQKEREKYVSFTRPIVKEAKAEKKKGRHPRDQKELDRAEDFIKKNPNFGKVDEGKGYQPEIEHSKLGDAKKKADKERESKLPPHLQGDALGKMKKAFATEGKKRGLWDNIHAKRKRGEKPAKPGDKDYPKTLNVEGLDKARKNVGADKCWDGYKAKGTKKKGGKEVPNCVKEGAAWTKKSGKNPEGGLNEKGRKSYERENPGSDLKAPQPEGGSRKKSFCARMGGMKKKLTSAKTANDPDSRINKSLRKWKCNEGEDKAFNYVVSKLKKKYGDGVLTKGDKIKPPTAAQKKAAAAHREKVAKQQAAEFKKDPSQGRYPPGYSNRGSD